MYSKIFLYDSLPVDLLGVCHIRDTRRQSQLTDTYPSLPDVSDVVQSLGEHVGCFGGGFILTCRLH